MLRVLTKSITSNFCLNNRLNRIIDVNYQIKDVTMIKGMKTNTPYFFIQKQKIQLPIDQLIFSINRHVDRSQKYLEFLDKDMNLYHPTTPLSIICQQPFYVRRKSNIYCILNNLPLITLNKNQQLDIAKPSTVVEQICKESLHDLAQNQNQLISGTAIHNLMVTNLLRHSLSFKIQKIRLKQILKVVQRQISRFQLQISQIQKQIKQKADKRLKNYTTFLFLQYLVMHYYIYERLSWDIMEPITVIFANIDIFVGYLFFVMRGRQWSLEQMHESYIDQKKYSNLKENGVDVQKYDELLKIREYLKLRLTLMSKNPYILMQMLQKPIKMLDTR